MIPYIEVRDKYSLKPVALVEPQECWFELGYQDVGEFEVYCRATRENLNALQKGRWVSIPNKRFIWVITRITYTFATDGARMISAQGYEAKWIFGKRCIFTPQELSGDLATAVYGLANSALGITADSARRLVDADGVTKFLTVSNTVGASVNDTQAPRGNLLEFITSLLKSKDCGHIVTLTGNNNLQYTVYKGEDKTASVRFSQSLDNLLTSEFLTDDEAKLTNTLVVSKVDDVEYLFPFDRGGTGIDRAEIVLASNISTKYEDSNGNERETEPTSSLYHNWVINEVNSRLAGNVYAKEEINAELDIANSSYEFETDFFVGDKVGVVDEFFKFSASKQIIKYTFKQDANGYGAEVEFGG